MSQSSYSSHKIVSYTSVSYASVGGMQLVGHMPVSASYVLPVKLVLSSKHAMPHVRAQSLTQAVEHVHVHKLWCRGASAF